MAKPNPKYVEKVVPCLDRAIALADTVRDALDPSMAAAQAERTAAVCRSARAVFLGEPRPRGPWPSGTRGPIQSDGRLTAEDHHAIADELREILATLRAHAVGGEARACLLRLRSALMSDCAWHCGQGAADSAYTDL